MSKKYPEEIYPATATQTINGQLYWVLHQKDYERAYDLGYQDGQKNHHDLTGWSNLTEAIKAGERIDWERLDGVEAKCVHPDMGTLTRCLVRRKCFSEETANGWCEFGENTAWEVALPSGWYGLQGWSLWVKGDLPLRKLTADLLEPGTCFKGKCMGEVRDCLMYQEAPAYYEVDDEEVGPVAELKAVGVNLYPRESPKGASTSPVNWLASQVEVLEVYGVGTFQKQKGQA